MNRPTGPLAPATLLLSRHGRTQWNVEGRYAGVTELELDATGRAQAHQLRSWAAETGLDAVRCSPLARAVATAQGAADALGLSLGVDARLRELDFGAAEGRTLEALRAEQPSAVAAFERDPAAHPLPGGEDPAHAARRAADALREAAAAFPGGRVLVVAHNTILRLALCELLGIPLARYRRALPKIDHAALTELRVGPGGASLHRLNVPLPAADAAACSQTLPIPPEAGIR